MRTEETMVKRIGGCITVIAVLSVLLSLNACSEGRYLRTESVSAIDTTAAYSVILYGCRYHGDLTNVALLQKEGSQYAFQVYGPQYDYKILKNVPAEKALKEAENFISCSHSRQTLLSRVLDSAGNTVGYELRPLYAPLTGYYDVLDVSYLLNGKVGVTIRLRPEAEKERYQ